VSFQRRLDKIMERVQALDPSRDYDVTLALSSIALDLGYGDLWVAENLSTLEGEVARALQENGGSNPSTGLIPRFHFYFDPTTRELRSHRFEDPATYDAIQAKLDWLNQLKSDPTRNAETFEGVCLDALVEALPSAALRCTRLHTDKGIDMYGTIPLDNGLGDIYVLCQVKLRDIGGGAEIRTFYGAAQYVLNAHSQHNLNRTPQDLRDFLVRMPMAPAALLLFFAATYSPEARDECSTLGVRPFDFPWIATELAHNATPAG